jgi:hypothetical protein
MISLDAPHTSTSITEYDGFVDLLEPVFRQGKNVYINPSIHEVREFAKQQVEDFVKNNEKVFYPVGLEKNLHELKQNLIIETAKVKNKK